MNNLVKVFAFSIFSIITSNSYAGMIAVPLATYSSTDETVASIGLRLEFGDVVKPSVVVAVRRTQTDKNNDVTGALADIAIPLNSDGSFKPTFKIMGLFGNTNTQGTAGVGFDFLKNLPVFGLGVKGANVEVGVHISKDGVSPYVGASTDGGPAKRGVNRIVFNN